MILYRNYLICLLMVAWVTACEGDTIYYIYGNDVADAGTQDATVDDDATVDEEDASTEDDIVIGILTVDAADLFGPLDRAVQLAVDEVNSSGGLLGGRMVRTEYIEEDISDVTAQKFRRLVEAGAVGVIGPFTPFALPEIFELVQTTETPFFSLYGPTDSGFNQASEASGNWGRGTYRIGQWEFADVAADEAISQGCASVGIVGVVDPNQELTTAAAKAAYEAKGLEWKGAAYIQDFAPGDVSGELAIFAGADRPDCIVMTTFHLSIALRDAPQGFTDAKFILIRDLTPQGLGVVDDHSVYNGSIGFADVEIIPERNQVYIDAYEAAYGEALPPPTHFYMGTQYDFAALMLLSIEAAGTTDGAAVRDAIPEVGSPGEVTIIPGQLAEGLTALRDGKTIDYEGAGGTADFTPGPYPVRSGIRCYRVVDADTLSTEPCEE